MSSGMVHGRFFVGDGGRSEMALLVACHSYLRGELPCVLCDGIRYALDEFRPQDSQAFGAPEGALRFLFYGVCFRHCGAKLHPAIAFVARRTLSGVASSEDDWRAVAHSRGWLEKSGFGGEFSRVLRDVPRRHEDTRALCAP